MYVDCHVHTHHSFDSSQAPEPYIIKAIEMGMDEICFTDHHDFNYPVDNFELNVVDYFLELKELQKNYQDKIKIKVGVEIGLDLDYVDEINQFIKSSPFEFVIGSIHVIDHTEFYYGEFFKGLTKDEAHHKYFTAVLECVKKFDCFDVLGHLDYISRYGPYQDKSIDYAKHQEVIEQIFTALIHKNKGIELNTSGYRTCNHPFPDFDLAQRFYDMGGRVVTVGSDSHSTATLGANNREVIDRLEKIGFSIRQ
ncbi:MAG: histidinol-phosphatase HisJ family protein [Erysipelotrichaceae bacterium]|nr:histidinol-phosphatase HisJ family protein [Erysipelotrichaceae bacterium]